MTSNVGATADRRRLLLEAARQLFGTRSYDDVTTTEIAKKAGVAYGLIAHHFGNKRGLYLAVMDGIRNELAAEQDSPVEGETLTEQLHNALRRHVDYIDSHRSGFLALLRGDLGADPDMRAMSDELRWGGASRILHRIGVHGEPPPVLRAAMRSWVAQFDELMLDRLDHGDTSVDTIVALAANALIAALGTVLSLDQSIELDPEVLAQLGSCQVT
ncbi:TetR/AcrR family transcriptional regulator [Candidatus Protofrankia datiscae]|uniref:Regulatory protein TetR n=1 Tax=Candidatus Protofrankia datiscae TaxID=2716812 RepID=F8AZ50_9ACTN|nr:TetR/AcrR family transcriptional regulator [Candidatus Protofrankia datiscae]AEH10517.1 regulatory protein TetR [Candidatus Protofrankia datiscae]